MQILSSTQSSNYQQQIQENKNLQEDNYSFQEALTVQRTLEEQNEIIDIDLGKFEPYADGLDLSKETKKLLKDILEDDNVSLEEIDKLTFEEAGKLNKILEDASIDGVSMARITSGNHVSSMLSATTLTNDENFNETMYNAMRDESDWLKRIDLMAQVQGDLFESYGDGNPENFIDWYVNKKDELDINYKDFLSAMNKKYQQALNELANNPKVLDEAIAEAEEKVNQYRLLLESYINNIKTEDNILNNSFNIPSHEILKSQSSIIS